MSPSRSKSKDKKVTGKEPLKSCPKPSTSATGGGGVPASGYNPLLGTFHTLDPALVSSVPPVNVNGRFRDIEDTDDPSGNPVGIGVEYDCVSNNGSWSGESEDPKDKPSQGPSRQEAIHGVDSEKREKIRQKNEKKHQRQKERRAQELHERCCGYLMSRKLEALAQQLIAMGFPSERATMALILNEGKVEESVAWLFEGGEDAGNQTDHNHNQTGNLKVDISQELAQIVEMEIKFKCSKQEVERAIVASEGDLDQAAENLSKAQKQESHGGDPPSVVKPSIANSQVSSTPKVQPKRTSMQQTDDKKSSAEPAIRNIQLLKKAQPNSQHAVATPSVEKRWSVGAAPPPPPLPPPSFKSETQFENEFKNLQLGSVVMMQRPQSKHAPTTSISSSSSSAPSYLADWNPDGFSHKPASTRSFNTLSYGSSVSNQFHYQPLPQQHYLLDHHATNHTNNNNGMWNRRVGGTSTPTPTLAAASSLGLFSGLGSNGGSHVVDWNGDWSTQFDYTNIDWSLNRLPTAGSGALRPNGMWMGSVRPATRVNGNGGDGVGVGSDTSGGEWASPFEEKDLFSLPRRFVSSPSL